MTEDLSLSGLRDRFNQLNDLSVNFVEFPRKVTSGFGAAGAYFDKGFRDDVLIGGSWLAKYPMSRLDATPKSQGTSSIPVSQPRVPAWTEVNWQEALEACRLMNRSDEEALTKAYVSGGGVDALGADMNGYHYVLIDTDAHFLELAVGNHIELSHALSAAEAAAMNTNNYDNAIHTNTTSAPTVRLGSSNQWVEGDTIIYERKAAKFDQENKKIFFTVALPTNALGVADITSKAGDTVSIRKYDLAGLEEWGTLKLECAMQAKAASPFGANGYPKGNNSYGRDTGDADEWQYYGDNDPTYTIAGHEIYKVLCGSGPDSWYHNNTRKTGVWCYNGNVYDWINAKTYDRKIQAGYPGEGHTFPAADNFIATIEAAAALCGAKDLALPITQAGAGVAEFGGDYAYLNYAGDRAFLVGGYYGYTDSAGVFSTNISNTPAVTNVVIGFRATL
ncbi:DGR target protein adtA [ANMV-1 virus]|nr:DGR target protein adtA [ANMV-1 virus]